MVRSLPLLDDAGRVHSVVSVLQDRTEVYEAVGRLAASEAHHRELVEATRDLVTWTDLEGRLVYVNPMSRVFLGAEPEDCVGRESGSFLHPEDRARITGEIRAWLEKPAADLRTSGRVSGAAGEVFEFEWLSSVARDSRGELVGIRSIGRDVTELRAMRTALTGLADAIEELRLLASPGTPEDPVHGLLEAGKLLTDALRESLE